MDTILYFASILLTCALTGWLSIYAWRHRSIPAASTYAVMAFSECLLALAELLSMLSPGQAQALFWFKLRFVFTAAVPVLWLVFALEYRGRKDWLSRRSLAIPFIIPVLTQIFLWTNNLHGLWVKQEVGFHQSGSLWLVETSARIPGLWYLVHSFYSLLLLLVGIGIILIAAWRKQRLYKGQAFLLSAGALIALVTSIIPAFNLMPKSEFNPFIPGIGASALLYALAIFRFQFLKRAPAMESVSGNPEEKAQEKRSLAFFMFIFVVLAAGIAAIGYLSYQNYERQFRSQVENQLSSIATLKENGLQSWRQERLADAESIYRNPSFSALVQRFLENPLDAQAQAELQTWLDVFAAYNQYDRIFLLDTQGVDRISSPITAEPVAAHLTQAMNAVLSTGQVTFLDFHRDTPAGAIHLSLLVPILAQQDNHPLGILVMRIDPQLYLYPYIQTWPVPSTSAETLLVRRDGTDALFLNELRFQKNTALTLRVPLEKTEINAVKAVLGQVGVVEGLDYRGVRVIADMRRVPDSPWYLISRMDIVEVYAPLRVRLWEMLLLFGVLALTAGAGLSWAWRQQQLRFYQARYQSTEALRVSEEKFRKAFLISPDAVAITRLSDGLLVNHPWNSISGIARKTGKK
jgi:PAS domain-containing protein